MPRWQCRSSTTGNDTESDETFELNLSNANGATIADADATATIIEDANLQTITIADRSRSENIAQLSRFISFGVDESPTRTFQLDWRVEEVPSLGEEAATIGADFLASPSSGTLNMSPGRYYLMGFEIVADTVPEAPTRDSGWCSATPGESCWATPGLGAPSRTTTCRSCR